MKLSKVAGAALAPGRRAVRDGFFGWPGQLVVRVRRGVIPREQEVTEFFAAVVLRLFPPLSKNRYYREDNDK